MMDYVRYFPFDKLNEMSYNMHKFEEILQFVVVLAFLYFFVKVFTLLDK